jgi:hypothetical protein
MTTCSEFLFLFWGKICHFLLGRKDWQTFLKKKSVQIRLNFFSFPRVNVFFQIFENSGFFGDFVWDFFSCEILILKFPFLKKILLNFLYSKND